jgi:hypothetical protein
MPLLEKKRCVNNPDYSYSGKESSPLGIGYSAEASSIGKIMEGRDGTMWMVAKKYNDTKVWTRVPTELANDTDAMEKLSKDEEQSNNKEKVPIKKKAAPKKKKDVEKLVKVSESEDDPVIDEPTETKHEQDVDDIKEETASEISITPKKVAPKEKPKPKPKAKAKPKESENGEEKKEKKPRKQTDFNYFMSYRMKLIEKENPGMLHKEKFGKVSSEWKNLTDDEKKTIVEKAKAE